MEKNAPHRLNGGWKPVAVIILIIIAVAILIKGNDVGQFRYDGPHSWKVFWGIYLFTVTIISPLIFKKLAPEVFSETSWKERARTAFLLVIVSFLPAVILNGVSNYIDYYASNKKWQDITAVIVDIPGKRKRRHSTTYNYTYEMTTDKDTILLETTLDYNIGDTLKLKIATTALGNVVAETR